MVAFFLGHPVYISLSSRSELRCIKWTTLGFLSVRHVTRCQVHIYKPIPSEPYQSNSSDLHMQLLLFIIWKYMKRIIFDADKVVTIDFLQLNMPFSWPIFSPVLGCCQFHFWLHTHCKMQHFIPVGCSYLYTGNFTISTLERRYSCCFSCLKLFYEARQYSKNGRFGLSEKG